MDLPCFMELTGAPGTGCFDSMFEGALDSHDALRSSGSMQPQSFGNDGSCELWLCNDYGSQHVQPCAGSACGNTTGSSMSAAAPHSYSSLLSPSLQHQPQQAVIYDASQCMPALPEQQQHDAAVAVQWKQHIHLLQQYHPQQQRQQQQQQQHEFLAYSRNYPIQQQQSMELTPAAAPAPGAHEGGRSSPPMRRPFMPAQNLNLLELLFQEAEEMTDSLVQSEHALSLFGDGADSHSTPLAGDAGVHGFAGRQWLQPPGAYACALPLLGALSLAARGEAHSGGASYESSSSGGRGGGEVAGAAGMAPGLACYGIAVQCAPQSAAQSAVQVAADALASTSAATSRISCALTPATGSRTPSPRGVTKRSKGTGRSAGPQQSRLAAAVAQLAVHEWQGDSDMLTIDEEEPLPPGLEKLHLQLPLQLPQGQLPPGPEGRQSETPSSGGPFIIGGPVAGQEISAGAVGGASGAGAGEATGAAMAAAGVGGSTDCGQRAGSSMSGNAPAAAKAPKERKPHKRRAIKLPARNPGRVLRCANCSTCVTPQWRCGPDGPRTLCNACGVKHKKGMPLAYLETRKCAQEAAALQQNSN